MELFDKLFGNDKKMPSKDIIEHMTTGLLVRHEPINIPNSLKIKNDSKAIDAETWDKLPEEARESLSAQGFYRQIVINIY
jgi:hypothetical protein